MSNYDLKNDLKYHIIAFEVAIAALFVFLQVLFWALKMDNSFYISWPAALWPTWCLLAFTIGANIYRLIAIYHVHVANSFDPKRDTAMFVLLVIVVMVFVVGGATIGSILVSIVLSGSQFTSYQLACIPFYLSLITLSLIGFIAFWRLRSLDSDYMGT